MQKKSKLFLALGALEEKFWLRFCELVELNTSFIDDRKDPEKTKKEVTKIVKAKNTEYWKNLLKNEINICCSIVNSVEDALKDSQVIERQLVAASVNLSGKNITVMPTPLAPIWRPKKLIDGAPVLGEANSMLER